MQYYALIIAFIMISITPATESEPPVKNQWNPGFIDLNNDGINDNAPDSDNDGIPNCIDSDYKKRGKNRRRGHGNAGIRWSKFYAMPDSVSKDSSSFETWWISQNPDTNWRYAWEQWQNRFVKHRKRQGWRKRTNANPPATQPATNN
jgi:hypothetical protein